MHVAVPRRSTGQHGHGQLRPATGAVSLQSAIDQTTIESGSLGAFPVGFLAGGRSLLTGNSTTSAFFTWGMRPRHRSRNHLNRERRSPEFVRLARSY